VTALWLTLDVVGCLLAACIVHHVRTNATWRDRWH
jgi:hypothetical protein